MTAPVALALFQYGELPPATQRRLLGVLTDTPALMDALAEGEGPLDPQVWRAAYAGAPAQRATRLLHLTDRPEDVAFALFECQEHRAKPLEVLFARWQLSPAQAEALLAPTKVPEKVEDGLCDPIYGPRTWLAAAARIGPTALWRPLAAVALLAPEVDDATLAGHIAAIVAAAPGWSTGDNYVQIGWARRALIEAAWARPALRTLMATSGCPYQAAAATQNALPAGTQAAALATLAQALANPAGTDDTDLDPDGHDDDLLGWLHHGVLALLDRPDTDPAVRADAVALLAEHPQLLRAAIRARVPGARTPYPVGTPVPALDADQVESLLLRGTSGQTSRVLVARELAVHPDLTGEQVRRLHALAPLALHDYVRYDTGWALAQAERGMPIPARTQDEIEKTAQLRAQWAAEPTRAATRRVVTTAVSGATARWRRERDAGTRDRRPGYWDDPRNAVAKLRRDDMRAAGLWLGDQAREWPELVRVLVTMADTFTGTLPELVRAAEAVLAPPVG